MITHILRHARKNNRFLSAIASNSKVIPITLSDTDSFKSVLMVDKIEFDNKVINCKCVCNKPLHSSATNTFFNPTAIMLLPCQHIIHKTCITKDKCPMCNSEIIGRKNISSDIHTDADRQINNDIKSITCDDDNNNNYSKLRFVSNIPRFIKLLYCISRARGHNDANKVCEYLMKITNTKINIINENKLIKNDRVIYIANHSTYYDFVPMYYVLRSGFVASTFALENPFGKILSKIIPLVFVKRGFSSDSVKLINNYLCKHRSIAMCPEGIITNKDSLTKFRSGAFKVNATIQPIVIKYNSYVHETNILYSLVKIMAVKKIDIDVTVLDPIYPPHNDESISHTREKIAKTGGFSLSRVSNYDMIDKVNHNI